MKEVLKEVPNVLKKQIFKRIGMGIVFALLGVITWIASKEFLFALPCLVAMAVLIVSGLGVLFVAITKRYVIVSGECVDVEYTRILKRTKAVYLQTDYGVVKLPIRGKRTKAELGSSVRCYIASNSSVYEYDGVKTVGDYYAVESFHC